MVKSVSSLTQSGVRDFLLQRVSAYYMVVFLLGFIAYLFCNPVTDFYSWHVLFESVFVKVAVFFFFLSLMLHAWIGLWAVATDYLKDNITRLMFVILVAGILQVCLVWAVAILWGR
jgi:succinate dehydrogenase / fumarate reductase membrane anchor subunit